MISETIDNWHAHLRGEFPGGLDELLHEDCVFWSPVVFAPQRGREMTKLYLRAAFEVLPGDAAEDEAGTGVDPTESGSSFRYTKRVLDGSHAVLEFESQMGDISVNGVDIITIDADGKIIEFKVMLRPRRAVEHVQKQMAAMLASMAPQD